MGKRTCFASLSACVQFPNTQIKSWAWLCVFIISALNGRDGSHIISALGGRERRIPHNLSIGRQREKDPICSRQWVTERRIPHNLSIGWQRDESQKSGWPTVSFSSRETLYQGSKADSKRRHSRSCSGFYMRLKATHLYTTCIMHTHASMPFTKRNSEAFHLLETPIPIVKLTSHSCGMLEGISFSTWFKFKRAPDHTAGTQRLCVPTFHAKALSSPIL